MPSSENRVIIACAGAGKTTRLVTEALNGRDRRIAIVTYTNNNVREIWKRFAEKNSGMPRHVDVMTWFGFLLRECARPYQRSKYKEKRIESILFVNRQSTRGIAEAKTRHYYFAGRDMIYSDKIARFVVECENESSKAVTARLGQIYTDVFIDELQDLAGWDLEVIRMLLESGVRLTLVGDPRQHIYSTNPSQKNKQYLGIGVARLAEMWEKDGLCTLEYMNATWRCNDPICEFSNRLWPGMDAMTPLRHEAGDHIGVFLVAENRVREYMDRYSPQVLRHSSRAKRYGCEAVNFGLSKGLQFKRVLIVPTSPIKRYLEDGVLSHVDKARDKLHVAVTRASSSVAFVFDGTSPVVPTRWNPCPEARARPRIPPALPQSVHSDTTLPTVQAILMQRETGNAQQQHAADGAARRSCDAGRYVLMRAFLGQEGASRHDWKGVVKPQKNGFSNSGSCAW